MSLWDDIDVTCRGCGKTSPHRIWLSLNSMMHPEARQQLLDGKLMTFTCPHCGTADRGDYPLLYHDMQRHFMVHFVCDGSTPNDVPFDLVRQIGDYRFRVVDSVLALQEKIHIFESDADDRVMEIFKAYQQRKDRKNFYPPDCTTAFAGFLEGKIGLEIAIAIVTDHCQYVRYPARQYEAMHHNCMSLIEIEQAQDGPHPMWRRIDQAYAKKILHYQ